MIQEIYYTQQDVQNDIEEILNRNKENKIKGWRESMNYLYNFSTNTRYIQEERLKLNIVLPLFYKHEYGEDVGFQITINCSKPEIVIGQAIVGADHYSNFEGQCVICWENVGSEKRKGLRAFEFKCNDKVLFRQFPPYPYFKHHNIIIDRNHTPQILSIDTIIEMLEMSTNMPGYKIASNTDRVGTGATNLTHRHFQAGDCNFTVFQAKVFKEFIIPPPSSNESSSSSSSSPILIQWLNYPCCCLKVIGNDKSSIQQVVFKLFNSWRNGNFETLDSKLQTCSLISTLNTSTNNYEFLIFPRNAEQPRFLTRSTLQCIKKEFVGIFELCGFAILPGRLKDQFEKLELILLQNHHHHHHHQDDSNTTVVYELNEILFNQLKDNGFESFSNWLIDYYFKYFNNELSIKDNLYFALQKSFLTILSDNSPISLNQIDLLNSWINQSNLY